MTRSSSGMNGKETGSEPAAIIALSKEIVVVPLSPVTSSVLLPVNLPKPCTNSTLRIFDIPLNPLVNWLTTLSFQSRTLSKSIFGSPNDTPWLDKCFASLITFATCSNAFDGIQPTLRHTPPKLARASTSTVSIPKSAARNAAE